MTSALFWQYKFSKFVFQIAVERNYCCFICSKIFDNFSSAKSRLKITFISKQGWVLLLRAWWIYVEHAKKAGRETVNERLNLRIKDHGIWKINKVNTPIVNWFLFLCYENMTWTWQSIPGDSPQNKCRGLLKALQSMYIIETTLL